MYIVAVVFVVTFHVGCYAARLKVQPTLPGTVTGALPVCTLEQLVEPASCAALKFIGFCESNVPAVRQFMDRNCFLTCGRCQICITDTFASCPAYKEVFPGPCEVGSILFDLMVTNCNATCGNCNPPTPIPPTTTGATTMAPTTEGQTTMAPITGGQTTMAPTTEGQTTMAPITGGQTTMAPTTEGQTTMAPITGGQTTMAPTTEGQTTMAPITGGQTTMAPTTEGPSTMAPTTEGQSTMAPTTEGQTTMVPTTEGQTTMVPTTESQTTTAPSTEGQTTMAPTTSGLTPAQDACLQAHNSKRELHGAAPLAWDPTLAQHAQEWANHLASIENLVHAEDTGEGENLYASVGSAPTSCVNAVENWYNEEPLYPYNDPPDTEQEFRESEAGHFTQVYTSMCKSDIEYFMGKACLHGIYARVGEVSEIYERVS